MKNTFIILLIIVIIIAGYVLYVSGRDKGAQESTEPETSAVDDTQDATGGSSEDATSDDSAVSVTPISHATLALAWGDTTIYVDPVGGAETFADLAAPDLVFVTDIHGDHLDTATLESVMTDETGLIAPQAVIDELPDALATGAIALANGSTTNQRGLSVEAVPMYNLPESEDAYHVKGRGNGYVLERDETRVYIAGDTEDIPEMRTLTDIDMAFVPMNLPYTMTVESAADAVLDFAPSVVYPYHYRGEDGLSDVNEFKRLVSARNADIEVRLLDWYPDADDADEASENENAASAAAADAAGKGPDVVIDLVGTNYEFSQEEITVEKGDVVQIELTSGEGFHDWVVDAFDAATDRVRDGETSTVTFVADETGTFEYYCSVGDHRERGMVGTLIVE